MSERRKYQCVKSMLGLDCDAPEGEEAWPPNPETITNCDRCGSVVAWDDPDADEDARLIKAAIAMDDGTRLPLDEVKRRLGRT